MPILFWHASNRFGSRPRGLFLFLNDRFDSCTIVALRKHWEMFSSCQRVMTSLLRECKEMKASAGSGGVLVREQNSGRVAG